MQQTLQEGEDIRLTMLETIREYGLEMLSSSGEMETAQQAHAAYYLKLAEEAAPADERTTTSRVVRAFRTRA